MCPQESLTYLISQMTGVLTHSIHTRHPLLVHLCWAASPEPMCFVPSFLPRPIKVSLSWLLQFPDPGYFKKTDFEGTFLQGSLGWTSSNPTIKIKPEIRFLFQPQCQVIWTKPWTKEGFCPQETMPHMMAIVYRGSNSSEAEFLSPMWSFSMYWHHCILFGAYIYKNRRWEAQGLQNRQVSLYQTQGLLHAGHNSTNELQKGQRVCMWLLLNFANPHLFN